MHTITRDGYFDLILVLFLCWCLCASVQLLRKKFHLGLTKEVVQQKVKCIQLVL